MSGAELMPSVAIADAAELETALAVLERQELVVRLSVKRRDLERQLALLNVEAALDATHLAAMDRYELASAAYYDALDALIAVQQQQQVLLRAHVGALRASLRGAL